MPQSFLYNRDYTALSQRRRSPHLGPIPEVLDLGRRSGHAPHNKGTWQVTEITAYLQVPGAICAKRAVRPVGISAIIGRRENKTAGQAFCLSGRVDYSIFIGVFVTYRSKGYSSIVR